MMASFCNIADHSQEREVCTRMLSMLEKDDIGSLFLDTEIPLVPAAAYGVWSAIYCAIYYLVIAGELYHPWSLAESELEEFI